MHDVFVGESPSRRLYFESEKRPRYRVSSDVITYDSSLLSLLNLGHYYLYSSDVENQLNRIFNFLSCLSLLRSVSPSSLIYIPV